MANPPAGPIRLFVLGDARIETPVAVIEPTAELVFATALYLILERGKPVPRRQLEAVLWPGVSPSAASHRLRQTLLKLRRVGIPVSPAGKTRITLLEVRVIGDFESLSLGQQLEESLNDRINVLPGYEPKFSSVYSHWLDSKRDAIVGLLTRTVLSYIAKQRVVGNWTAVESAATKLLEMSPLNEEATLALAEAYAMRGSKLEGVRILDNYLNEVGRGPSDLRVPATAMRKRIADRMPPRPSRTESDTPMIERGAMMETLGELMRRARTREGQACVIWGEAGIGKSRLLSEFSTFATLQGISAPRVQCRPSDVVRPLSVFIDLVPHLRTLRGAIGCSAETIAYLDRLTKRRILDNPAHDNTDAQFIYSRIERALFDLLDAVSDEVPLFVQIEDTHWIDRASMDVLHHLIEWCADRPILFACTTRDRTDWQVTRTASITEIQLPPLSALSAAEVVYAVVRQQGRTIDAEYVNWCVRVADGNPFFLEELAKQWLETGPVHLPPASLNSVLEQRISRLSAPSLQLLQASAALEGYSTFERIEQVLGCGPHELLRALNDLADAGMLLGFEQRQHDRPLLLQPRHELIATAALGRLTLHARALLHRMVAIVLEKQITRDRSTALLWDCAKHWQLAGDPIRAFELARSCGLHLLELGLPDAAADAFERALPFCSTSDETIDVLQAQARAYSQSSSWEALLSVERVVRSLIAQGDTDSASAHDELELLALRAHWKTNKDEEALERLSQCLLAAEASAEHRTKAGTIALMLQDLTGRHDEMHSTYGIIDGLSRDAVVSELARIEAGLVFHTLCGDLTKAVAAADKLLNIQREKEDQGDLFRHLLNASVTYRTVGLFDNAISCLNDAVEIAKAHRLPKCLLRAFPMLAHLALERGLNDEARYWYNEICRVNAKPDDVFVNVDIQSIETRLGIVDSSFPTATRQRSVRDAAAIPHHLNTTRTYALALHCATLLLQDDPLSPHTVAVLEHGHLKSRRSLAQAFGTYVLFAAMHRSGQRGRADALLAEYHGHYRRETWQASQLFEQTVAKLSRT